MKRILLTLISLGAISFVPFVGYGTSFDAFTGISDTGKLGFAPTLGVPTTFDSASLELWFDYGISKNIDVQMNASTLNYSSGAFSWGGIYLLPRYDFGSLSILEYNILALGVGFGGGFSLDVQYHTEFGIIPNLLSFELNIIGNIIPSFGIYGIFAPVLYLLDWLALYVEINPSFVPGFGVEFVPGVDISLGNLGELNVCYSTSQEIGVEYSILLF